MKQAALKELSTEELQNKKKSLRMFSGIFIVLILALAFFALRDYLTKGEMDWAMMTINICTLGGFLTVYQELKQVQAELALRV